MSCSFVDIHCHLLPGIDDGAADLDDALAMARIAVDQGTTTIIATPHQLGTFGHNAGDDIRRRVGELQQQLGEAEIPLQVLPGGEARIEDDLVARLKRGDVLTLGDRGRHVLLELPHELYLPFESLLEDLAHHNVVGILSHPERNHGILRQREVLQPLVEAGCLMQVTGGSLCGTFGPDCQKLAEWMLGQGFVHFVATDAHGTCSRRPLMRRAYERVCELAGEAAASDLCSRNPGLVAEGRAVRPGRRAAPPSKRKSWWGSKGAA
jgi:protein-tyrosine phosphatase